MAEQKQIKYMQIIKPSVWTKIKGIGNILSNISAKVEVIVNDFEDLESIRGDVFFSKIENSDSFILEYTKTNCEDADQRYNLIRNGGFKPGNLYVSPQEGEFVKC